MKAFILAAGFGKRLRPYTDNLPKPLLAVNGRTLLDRALDHLAAAGVSETVINTHYLAEKIESHVAGRTAPRARISREETLLDTGGGIKKALPYFENQAFYVLSGDGLWTDGPGHSALARLKAAWKPDIMDILILLQPLETFHLTQGAGDYDISPEGRAVRSRDKTGAYMFTSMRINAPGIFEKTPDAPFSYLDLLDAAESCGRLHAIIHDGEWHHISTPTDLEAVDVDFRRRNL